MPDVYLSPEIRSVVRERAKHCCEYCLALSRFSFHPFAIDHIVPVSKGGSNALDNLALACQHCNNSKYNKLDYIDPLTRTLSALFNPRQNVWETHFTWDVNYSTIIGLTVIGRATINCLKMNREEAVNLRKALYQYGVHPPV